MTTTFRPTGHPGYSETLLREPEGAGRGLLLVSALASDWGTDVRRWGKVVWADLEERE
ncbi:hypothetical protein [Streptomyces sp. NPDC003660]